MSGHVGEDLGRGREEPVTHVLGEVVGQLGVALQSHTPAHGEGAEAGGAPVIGAFDDAQRGQGIACERAGRGEHAE